MKEMSINESLGTTAVKEINNEELSSGQKTVSIPTKMWWSPKTGKNHLKIYFKITTFDPFAGQALQGRFLRF